MTVSKTIFIPKRIKAGFQKRSDTYTGKLAYVIYQDGTGKWRKEPSWNSWRRDTIEPVEIDNEPTSGFVLNKKVGGHASHWNHRQTYCRVHDPRGFEFEITIPNLLYILENTSSIKGKGLEGDFVYSWDGKDLLLMPTCSPDYTEIKEYTEMLFKPEKLKGKDLVLGGTYLTNKNQEWVYLGRFDYYEDSGFGKKERGTKNGRRYYFQNGGTIERIGSLTNRIVRTISTEHVENYAELMEKLEGREYYSPYNPDTDIYEPYTIEELTPNKEQYYWRKTVYFEYLGAMCNASLSTGYRSKEKLALEFAYTNNHSYGYRNAKVFIEAFNYHEAKNPEHNIGIDEMFQMFTFLKRRRFLMNGKELSN